MAKIYFRESILKLQPSSAANPKEQGDDTLEKRMDYYNEIKNEIEFKVVEIEKLHDGKVSVLADGFFLQVVLPSLCDVVYYKNGKEYSSEEKVNLEKGDCHEKIYRDYNIKGRELFDYEPLLRNAVAYIENRYNPMPNLNIVKVLVYLKKKLELQVESINNRLTYEIESLLDTEECEEDEKKFCGYFNALYEYAKDNQDIFVDLLK